MGDAITDQQKNDCGEHALLLLLGAAHSRSCAIVSDGLHFDSAIHDAIVDDVD